MRVVVVERHHVGFGASGRNGGWCSALLPISLTALERRHGRGAAIAWQRAMIEHRRRRRTVRRSSAAAGHDAQFHKGGTLTVARNAAQFAAARGRRSPRRGASGSGEDDVRLARCRRRSRPRSTRTRAVGAMFTPHCAAVHPLRLARAIADAGDAARVRASSKASTSSTSSRAG